MLPLTFCLSWFLFNNCCSAQRTSTAMSVSGRRGACGRSDHGLPSEDGTANLCCACRRPGPSDNSTTRAWRHIGAGECWDSLVEWEAAAAGTWPHRRDLLQEPLQANECICSRVDCVSGLYSKFRKQRAAAAGGSSSLMETGQRALLGRYPSLPQQVIISLCACL